MGHPSRRNGLGQSMTHYTIIEQHGTHCLMLGNQLIMQTTNRADCERVKAGLEHRHPDRKES